MATTRQYPPPKAPADTVNRFPRVTTIRLDAATLERIDALARARGRSRNAEMRAALTGWLLAAGEVAR